MMQTNVLCIVQARFNSTRLPGKMLLKLGSETLIERGHRIACEAFGEENVVVAIPAADEAGPLGDELRRIGARIFAWDGDERDVLGRFHACAHTYRWHPDSIIVRYTSDDHRKSVDCLRMVANGERLPVEIGGEAFTLEMLDDAVAMVDAIGGGWTETGYVVWGDREQDEAIVRSRREHLTLALFPHMPPPQAPEGCWTIDTPEQLEEARALLAGGAPE